MDGLIVLIASTNTIVHPSLVRFALAGSPKN